LSLDDSNDGLRRITILERNVEYYDAAEQCFTLYQKNLQTDIALRGFKNLWISAWHANSLSEMKDILSEFLLRIEKMQNKLKMTPDQVTYLDALSWEAQGWLANPPDSEMLGQAVQAFMKINEVTQALDLILSLVAYVKPEHQVNWSKYGLNIAEQLAPSSRDAYYLLLVESLLLYAEGDEKQILLQEIFKTTKRLGQVQNRTLMGNIAVLHAVDLLHPHRVEAVTTQQIRQDNVHELVRSLVEVTQNQLRGKIQALLGNSYYRMAESEQVPELRQDLYEKAKDYFLQSVSTFERTPAYGELLYAYTLAGTGFLSIAELEQDLDRRNELYELGETHLRKARTIGEQTHCYQLRARAAINLGVALERVTWFDLNPDSRKDRLMEIYNLQLEGRDFAEKTKGLRAAGYATMNASEMCGFLSDLETHIAKKREWAATQRDLSQKGLQLLMQTQDFRGQVVALSYAAFACAKLADLTPTIEEKIAIYEEMLRYGENACALIDQVPDPVATAYAFQQAGDAAQHLGILKGDAVLLQNAASFYEKATIGWSKTGERHKHAQAITQHANCLLYRSSLDFTPDELDRLELLEKSEQLHKQAVSLFSKLFFFHDVGENHWHIGQIHLLRRDYSGAQEYFDKVQKAFVQAAELVPHFADVYSVFSTFGITFVGLIDGLNIIDRGDYAHAALLFEDLAAELETETERSLRQLRQLLVALTNVCQFAALNDTRFQENAQTELERLQTQLTTDAYQQQLPYSIHKTIHRLQIFLVAPKLFFPPLLLDIPIQEKMLTMVQTRHIVGTALNMYQATASQRDNTTVEPTEDIIRSYVARMNDILADR
jgi:hypothetical protein